MRVRIRAIRLARAGFVVSWHPANFPNDIRVSVLSPERLPPGHEWLESNTEVELQFDRSEKIISVQPAQ